MQKLMVTWLQSVICIFLLVPIAHGKALDPLMVKLPNLPVIPGATWQWVGQQMAIDGTPMSVKLFEYAGKERDVERFYVKLWKSRGHGQYKAKNWGKYKIIGHELDGFYASVQYRKEGMFVKGKVVVTEVGGKYRRASKTNIPTPRSAHNISKLESIDAGKRAETVTFDSNKGVDFNTRYYENQYNADGWTAILVNDPSRETSMRHFQRGAELVQVTVKGLPGISKKQTHIIVHWIK
ncbi:MAG: hypothetical protein COA99_19480 [Moraxellaceae bacterium]|nr:MAG: hypothetical protein COA99_19480 [Moraxellaceae bacterium]